MGYQVVSKTGHARALKVVPWLLLAELLWLCYCAFTYTGPYRWLAELSLYVFGAYQPKLIVLTLLFFATLPSLLLMRYLRAGSAATAFERPVLSFEEQARLAVMTKARDKRVGPWITLAMGGAIISVLAARQFVAASAGTTLTRISCASIEAGPPPKATWLDIEGTALGGAAVTTEENSTKYTYVPLVSDTWTKAKPLAVLLRFDSDSPGGDPGSNPRSFQGEVAIDGLPGMVRVAYEKDGVRLDDALVLNVGRVPDHSLLLCELGAVGGVLALLLGSFLIYRAWPLRDPWLA